MGHKIHVPLASIMALTLAGMQSCPPIDKDAEDFYDFMGVDYAKDVDDKTVNNENEETESDESKS